MEAGMERRGICKIQNPQHQFLFLAKRPDLLDFDTDLENAWFGVTVTGSRTVAYRCPSEKRQAKHYHVTFEPLFDDPGTVDLSGINWIVVSTMTGSSEQGRFIPDRNRHGL